MQGVVIGWLQLALSLIMCAIVGAPQTTFSTLQHFMLMEHIYEDRCKLSSRSGNYPPLYCEESRTAYANVYNAAGLGFAIAFLPAFFSVKFGGYAFTNLICCLSIAAGAVIITDSGVDQWVNDRMSYGYTLLAVSAPFAIMNYCNGLYIVSSCRKKVIALILLLFSVLQLSPLVWSLISRGISTEDVTILVLFQSLLWVSSISLAATMLLMLFATTSQEFYLLELGRTIWTHFTYSIDDEELIPLVEHEEDFIDFDSAGTSKSYSIFHQPFFPLLLAYLADSTSIDILYLSGEVKAIFYNELRVSQEITWLSPVLAACALPLFYLWVLKWGLRSMTVVSYLGTLFLTFSQYLQTSASSIISSSTVGICQVCLVWSTVLCIVKSSTINCITFNAACFLLSSALVKWYLLPMVEIAPEFNSFLLNMDPYLSVLIFQAILSWMSVRYIDKEVMKERRIRLEIEAETAFNEA